MLKRSNWALLALAVSVFVAAPKTYGEVPSSDTLLPNTTKGYLSVASVDRLKDDWNKTLLGQLMQDPAMKPFIEDFRRQMQEKWTKTHQKLGITWDDLDGVPSGEVSLALLQLSNTEVAAVVLADVTGHDPQVKELLEKVNKNMADLKAVKSQKKVLDTTVTVYDIPKREDLPARQAIFVVKDDLLAASDSLKAIEGLLGRRAKNRADSLASVAAYMAVMNRVQKAAGELKPHARWYVDPFGFADSLRIANTQPRKRGTDMLKILKEEGFTAIQGVGGFVNFAVAPYEMLHRTFVYAPGNTKGGARFELAARMLDMPNGGNFIPPDWVPRDVVSCASANVNVPNAFESSKTLVNNIVGDEVFEDVLESIATDENGPKIDIRKDVIKFLGNRVVMVGDLKLPITPKSEQMVYAVTTTNQEHMQKVIRSWMETDPDTKLRQIAGHDVWEIIDEKAELPMVTIEGTPGEGTGDPEEPEEKEERALPANSAVTVAYGYLFVATHIDVLTKILTSAAEQGEKLANSPDYQRVDAELTKLAQGDQFVNMFVRTDDAYQGVYELLKAGRMPEAESMIGKMLNSMLGEGKEGVLRTQRIDASKLPEYDMVRRYLGPAGLTGTTEDDGWIFTGFTLPKDGSSATAKGATEETAATPQDAARN